LDWKLIFSAIGSVGTVLIAILVFVEGRRIRSLEWLSKSHEMWQGFNVAVLANKYEDRFRQIYVLRSELPLDNHDNHFMYMFLNVVHIEYEAAKQGLMSLDYCCETIAAALTPLEKQREHVLQLVKDAGYDKDFRRLVEHAMRWGNGPQLRTYIWEQRHPYWSSFPLLARFQ
jgi:hypothetical protein